MVLGRNETILLGVCLVCGGGRCYKHNIYYFCLHVGGLVRGSGYGGGGGGFQMEIYCMSFQGTDSLSCVFANQP